MPSGRSALRPIRRNGPAQGFDVHHRYQWFRKSMAKQVLRVVGGSVTESIKQGGPKSYDPGVTTARTVHRRNPLPEDFEDTCLPDEGYHGSKCEC